MLKQLPTYVSGNQIFQEWIFRYPNFQRAYSWEPEQIDTFLSDMANRASCGEYYMGMIYYISDKKNKNIKYIIDGQQRITSLFLLVNGIRILKPDCFDKLNVSFFRDDKVVFDSEISTPFSTLLFRGSIDEIEYQFDNESYINLTKMQMFVNQKYILNKIKDETKILLNIENILNNIKFLFFDCENFSISSEIFENINSKGLKLTNTDIIKNAYFSRIRDDGTDSDFSSNKYRTWCKIENNIYNEENMHGNKLDEKYVRDKTSKFRNNLEMLFVIYYQLKYNKKYVKTNYNLSNVYIGNMKNMDSIKLVSELNEIRNLSSVATYIFNPDQQVMGEEFSNIQRALNFMDKMAIKLHYPLAVVIYYQIRVNSNYKQNITELERLFERLALFHFVFNGLFHQLPSAVEGVYMEIANKVYRDSIGFVELESLINEKILRDKFLFANPDIINKMDHMLFTLDRKREIMKRVKSEGIDRGTIKDYKLFDSSKEIKYIYSLIEKFLSSEKISTIDIETIEHINNFDEMLNDYRSFKIENLIPLEKILNDECTDKPVDEKIDIYRKSMYHTVKEFVKIYDNNADNWGQKWLEHLSELFAKMIKGDE